MNSKTKKIAAWSAGILLVILLFATSRTGGVANPLSFDGSIDTRIVMAQTESDQAELLDVRTPVEYDLDHAVNSKNYNVELMKKGQMPEIDKDKRVYVYCRSGNRSAVAADLMRQSGFTNIVDLGGISAWVEGGGDLVQSQIEDYLVLLEQMGQSPIQSLGPEDAETVIVKYADFSCPYCARYTLETEPQILDKYVKTNNRKVRYEFRNYTYLGGESALAANGGYCANEQSLFWPFHDSITRGFSQNGSAYYSTDNFALVIEQQGGDSGAFRSCLESDKYSSVISAETLDVKSRGINSTPTVFVGDVKLEGAYPFEVFKEVIENQ